MNFFKSGINNKLFSGMKLKIPFTSSYANNEINSLPYIGIKARLSQVLLNQWSIILIILIVKLILFKGSLEYSLSAARQYSILTCNSAQTAANSISSLPQQLTNTANSLVSMGIDESVVGLISTLQLLLTGVQNLIIFALEMLIGTYACLTVSLIDGAVDAVVNTTESIINFTNKEIQTASSDLESGLQKLSDALNDVAVFVSNIESFFTGDTEGINQVNLTITALRNFQIPTSINSKLDALKQNIPDYSSVKNAIVNEIKEPFELINNKLKDSLSGSIKFQAVSLSPASSTSLSSCNPQDIKEIFDQINNDIDIILKAFLITMAVLAAVICLPIIYDEYCRWKWLHACAELKDKSKYEQMSKEENIIMITIGSSHWKVRVQNLLAKLYRNDAAKTMSRWFVDYLSYGPMANIFLIGSCGILMVILQFSLLAGIKKQLPRVESEITDIGSRLAQEVNNELSSWVDDTNGAINVTEVNINQNLLGWVETATSTINKTLNVFLTSMDNSLNETFQGTPLYNPISSVIQCVVGNKIESAMKGLTWVHDKAHVSIPRIDKSLILGNSNRTISLNQTSDSNSTVALSRRIISLDSSVPDIEPSMNSLVETLIGTYEKSLITELYVSISLIGIWFLFAIAGFVYCYLTTFKISRRNNLESTFPGATSTTSTSRTYTGKINLPYSSDRGNTDTVSGEANIDQGWKFNWFNPPSFLTNDPYPGDRTPTQSPMITPPLAHSPLELKHTKPLSIKMRHPSMLRHSERATSDYVQD